MSIDVGGWRNFNTASFSSHIVAVGDKNGSADYVDVSHPYARPITRGATKEVMLLAQNFNSTAQVVWAESIDSVGDDFGLYCATCCQGASSTECDWTRAASGGTAGVALDALDYDFDAMMHGRWMWPYIADPAPDMDADTPSILFSGTPDGSTCPDQGTYSEGDIYLATWDPVGQAWEPYDSGDTDSCPDAVIVDAHDPGITPLPDDQYKVYVIAHGQDLVAHYFNGTSVEAATASPQIMWDDGFGTIISDDCMANVDSFAYVDAGGTPHEGMFFYLHDSGVVFQSGTCTSGTTYSGATFGQVYFAELQN